MALTIFFALLLWASQVTTDSKIHCSVPSVMSGETATLTCHFMENIQQRRKEFLVHYYADDQSFKEIIYCHWFTSDENSDKPVCKLKPGYVYGVLDNTTFTLKIRTVTEEDVGKYQCQQLPSDPTRTETCSFTLKAAEETSSASSTSSAVRTGEEPIDDSTLLIVVLPVLGGILGAAAAFIFICRKRLPARCRQCRNRSEESGVSFSKSAGGNGSVVRDEQSAPMLDEKTAPTENKATKSELSEQPASGEVISENTAEESPLLQPSKVPEESSAVVSVGSEKTSTGQDLLSPQKDTIAHVKHDTANIESSNTPAISEVTNKKPVDNSPIGAALKALDETGVVIILGAEKIEKTKIGQDLLQYYRDKEYEQIQLHNLRQWHQYATNRDKKYLIVIGEAITNDPNVSEHAWSSFLRQVRGRQCPVVITVRSNEKLEESAKAGLLPSLQSIPVVLAEVKSDVKAVRSSSRGDVAPSCEGISPGVQIYKGQAEHTEAHDRHSSSENLTNSRQEEETFGLVIYVPESKQKKPSAAIEEETRKMKAMLKETGISDIELAEVTYERRLGKPRVDGTPSPLMINVQTKATKEKILKKAEEMNKKIRPYEER